MSTGIEWVLNPDGSRGITRNSKTGCLNGCPYCYARKLANGRLFSRYMANTNYPSHRFAGVDASEVLNPFYPRWWPERLEQIRKHKQPAGIFLDDMSDWMGDYWPEEWTQQELQVMRDCPQHRFYTLTKQPQNLPKWSPFPENCWVGVTATNPDMFTDAYNRLICIDAKVKYISLEPFLSWGDLYELYACRLSFLLRRESYPNNGIDWLIIGAQTNPYKPPKIEWVQEIVEAADKAGIPVFLKDNLRPLICGNEDIVENTPLINKKFSWRQEMPSG